MMMTNLEASQGLDSLGQIVVNLSISSAFPAYRALAGKSGNHVQRPYHTCVGKTPDQSWIEAFAVRIQPVDRDAANMLMDAIRTIPPAAAPPVGQTPAKAAAKVAGLVTSCDCGLIVDPSRVRIVFPEGAKMDSWQANVRIDTAGMMIWTHRNCKIKSTKEHWISTNKNDAIYQHPLGWTDRNGIINEHWGSFGLTMDRPKNGHC